MQGVSTSVCEKERWRLERLIEALMSSERTLAFIEQESHTDKIHCQDALVKVPLRCEGKKAMFHDIKEISH